MYLIKVSDDVSSHLHQGISCSTRLIVGKLVWERWCV